jgi:hypothetical protein
MEASTVEKPKGEKPKGRPKNPSYVVLRETENGDFALTSAQISAPSRKAAVIEATKDYAQLDKEGTFIVIPQAEFQSLKRATKSAIVDEWS